MPKKRPELSRGEWLIMNTCWGRKKFTVRHIYEDVQVLKKWEYRTVKTMMDRLVKKGYLKRKKLGPLGLYDIAVPHEQVQKKAIDYFCNVILNKSLVPLFVNLEKKKMSKEEVAALKSLAAKAKKK